MRAFSGWRWHLDEVFVKINGERHYLWRAVDQEGEVLEAFVSKKRGCKAALKFLRKMMKRYPRSDAKPPEIRHCPFCRLPPLQPAKTSLFMGQLQAQARPCTRPVASARGGLISCRWWRTQTCEFPLTVPEEMKKYYAELK